MITQNNSTGKDNWSQRLNPDDPSTPWNETLETCNVTAAITSAVTAQYDLAKASRGLRTRPPMDLLYFMRSDAQCLALYKSLDPLAGTPMNEWMPVLALAIGLYLRLPYKLEMVSSMPLNAIVKHVLDGDGIIIHGQYEFARKDGTTVTGGHFQSLAGIKYTVEDEVHMAIQYVIVDDPFGNPTTKYVDTAGNDIDITFADFMAKVKPMGSVGKDVIILPRAVNGVYAQPT